MFVEKNSVANSIIQVQRTLELFEYYQVLEFTRGLHNLIPTYEKKFPTPVYSYQKIPFRKEQSEPKSDTPQVEISILTPDKYLFDISSFNEQINFIITHLNDITSIQLTQIQSPDNSKPYRAKLEFIRNSTSFLSYTAEGDKRLVSALIEYGKKCIFAYQD